MKLKFKCGGCGQMLSTDSEKSGKVAPCPKCGHAVTVPFPIVAAISDVQEISQSPSFLMTTPYASPNSEPSSHTPISPDSGHTSHTPIRLKGAWASTGSSCALCTTSCRVNPLNPILDFCYEPNSTKHVAIACYFVLIALMALQKSVVLGWMLFMVIYAIVIVIMSRRVRFNLRDQDLCVDHKRSLVSIRMMKRGQCYEMAFKVCPTDMDRLLNLATSFQNAKFKKRNNLSTYVFIIFISLVISAVLKAAGIR